MKEIQEKYPKSLIFVGRLLKENLKENVKNTKEYFMQTTDLDWDTPFSYAAKIDNQKELMSQWYSVNKQKYGKPKYQWKKTGATINEKKECLGENFTKGKTDAEIEKIYDEELKSKGYEGELNSFDKYHDMIFSSDYNANNVPFNKSGLKLETAGVTLNQPDSNATEAVTINWRKYYPYIPGLSDSIAYTNHPDSDISYRVAGTDCIGLVQRSMSYINNESNNTIYSAINDEKYRREAVGWENKTSPESAINNLHNTSYAVMIGDKNTIFEVETEELKNGIMTTVTKKYFNFFKYLVPGDIVYYPDQHIMIVNSISEPKYTEDGEAYWEDGSGVTILENVYHGGDGINGVGKTRTFGQLIDSDHNKDVSFWRQK